MVEKDDRPDRGTRHELLDGAAGGEVPDDDVPAMVAAGEPPTRRIEGQRVDNLRPGDPAPDLTRVPVPDA